MEKDTDGIRSLYSAMAGNAELIDWTSHLVTHYGYSRDDIIDGMHDAIIHHYNEGDVGQAVALKHLMILGQWAAKILRLAIKRCPIPPINGGGLQTKRFLK